MNLIDSSYFVGELDIPGSNREGVGSTLTHFINKYAPEVLRNTLGLDLYNAFSVGLAEVSIPVIWTDLLQGKEYTDATSGVTRRWRGVVDAPGMSVITKLSDLVVPTGVLKRCYVANYVYYYFVRNNVTQSTPMSEVKGKSVNAVNVTPIRKMVSAWNEMSMWLEEMWLYLDTRKDDYPEWTSVSSEVCGWKFAKINEFAL